MVYELSGISCQVVFNASETDWRTHANRFAIDQERKSVSDHVLFALLPSIETIKSKSGEESSSQIATEPFKVASFQNIGYRNLRERKRTPITYETFYLDEDQTG
jgi:hypothetical protein